ncbi:cupin domain-containing protein [Larkinella soli]|uniref:cupin domain-containing protein n=1 Tax=Larkinella soli TaxID=1770527 RepID=UPI000FFC31C0|nr:cupin domain-containing protein [Larkinella soli]
MAFKGKELRNPKTGQNIRFVRTKADTNGELLEMITTYETVSKEPVPHYHPTQDEYFEVLEGEVTVRLAGGLRVLKAGDQLHIAPKTVHSMWNNTRNRTVLNWKVMPALDTEYFLETANGLVNDGKTNETGTPGLLQVALMVNRFNHVFRPAKPPFGVQKVVFGILSPFARLLGYRSTYPQYID